MAKSPISPSDWKIKAQCEINEPSNPLSAIEELRILVKGRKKNAFTLIHIILFSYKSLIINYYKKKICNFNMYINKIMVISYKTYNK